MLQKAILSVLLFFSILMISPDRCRGQEKEGEVAILSEKIGDRIDLEESKIYGLFYSTEGFQSAVLYKYPDGVYAFKVIYKDDVSGEERVKWISRTEAEIIQIRELIDNFQKKQEEEISIEKNPSFKLEPNFNIGFPLEGENVFGMVNISKYLIDNYLAFEASAAIFTSDIAISGNFSLNLPVKTRFIPFATIGYGICIHFYRWLNYGGGIKVRLTDKLGLRTEYRHFSIADESGDWILCGIFYFPKSLSQMTKKFHLSFEYVWPKSVGSDNSTKAFDSSSISGETSCTEDESDISNLNVGVEFSLKDNYRIGLSLSRFPPKRLYKRYYPGIDAEIRYSENLSEKIDETFFYSLFVDYVVTPSLSFVGTRVDFSTGVGIVCGSVSIDGYFFSNINSYSPEGDFISVLNHT